MCERETIVCGVKLVMAKIEMSTASFFFHSFIRSFVFNRKVKQVVIERIDLVSNLILSLFSFSCSFRKVVYKNGDIAI